MEPQSIARTIRRCTAILALLLATFTILFQGYLAYQGFENDIEFWSMFVYLSYSTFFGALAYLIGSVGLSVSGDSTTEATETQ